MLWLCRINPVKIIFIHQLYATILSIRDILQKHTYVRYSPLHLDFDKNFSSLLLGVLSCIDKTLFIFKGDLSRHSWGVDTFYTSKKHCLGCCASCLGSIVIPPSKEYTPFRSAQKRLLFREMSNIYFHQAIKCKRNLNLEAFFVNLPLINVHESSTNINA
jgi:hypothetical protein